MKKKNFKNKLIFSKRTISNLTKIKGGGVKYTIYCNPTVRVCPQTDGFCADSNVICIDTY